MNVVANQIHAARPPRAVRVGSMAAKLLRRQGGHGEET
jgi:hypothetical protein